MTRGGPRPGAGRPRGSRDTTPRSNASTLAARAAAVEAQHPDWGAVAVADACGVTRQAVSAAKRRASLAI